MYDAKTGALWQFKTGETGVPNNNGPAPAAGPSPTTGTSASTMRPPSSLGVENVTNIRNANREEMWSNPWAITPARGRTKAGTAVTFTNTTQVAHTLKARDGSWTSGIIAPDQSASVTVAKPGTYEYVCQEHPWSIGQSIVLFRPALAPRFDSIC